MAYLVLFFIKLDAEVGIEPTIKDLQSSALPLGHAAEKDSIESFYDLNSKVTHSLLFICNGHGEDVIASEIIKILLKFLIFLLLIGGGIFLSFRYLLD